jgi:glycosyltransferase involved in cell wall biosynthesis
MFKDSKVSLILPTFNEAQSIRQVIDDFEALGLVDEIIVVNNNAALGTSEQVAPTSAQEVHEPKQGYGHAIRRGFTEAIGDLIVVCEPDGTFVPSDIHKFLAYSEDVPIVYGSRTVNNFIWQGANMGRFLKWGNWFTAKIIEVLFNTNSLSDVGCTFRLIHRDALEVLEPHFKAGANLFGLEMMLLGYRFSVASVQIPINYKQRIGKSSVTGDLWKAVALGLQMIAIIVMTRLRRETISLSQLRWSVGVGHAGVYGAVCRCRWIWSQ